MYTPNYKISDELLDKIAKIEAARSLIDTAIILPEREIEMHYRATVEATHSSTSIEGNPLDIKQVELALSSGSAALSRHRYAETEVRNYKQAIDFADKRKEEALKADRAISMDDILKLHSLVADNLLEEKRVGVLRRNPVYIQNEKEEVVYEAAPARSVKTELEELLEWLDTKAKSIHPVIASAILHYQFVSIHPFADGNGRTTRLLTSLYLGLRDYDFRGALVLDSYYAADRREYYDALDLSDNYGGRKAACLDSWIMYFAEGFLASAHVLQAEVKILSSISEGITFPRRISRDDAELLSYMKQFGTLSISEAERILPHISRRTVQRRLSALEEAGYIISEGQASSTRYQLRQS